MPFVEAYKCDGQMLSPIPIPKDPRNTAQKIAAGTAEA